MPRVTLSTMTTDQATEHDRRIRPTNGRVVSDQVATVPTRLIRPTDPTGSYPTEATRPTRPDQGDQGDPTNPTRPDRGDPTVKATKDPTRPDRAHPTEATRPRRLGRKATESVDQKARRAQLADQGATVGIPRGYGWAFFALVVTTLVSAGAAFWFVFGNVTDTAGMVGVPWAQQKVVSPAVDVIVLGLTFVVQYLVMANATADVIALTRRLLVGASALMLVLNATPPVLAALTTDYAGPLLKATEKFTPAFDQMTTGQLWGRAAIDAVITGILVAWSHWGPKVVRGFAEIKLRADRAALVVAEARTLATEADRAEADRARSEATALLDRARSEATNLIVSARSEATRLADQAGRELAAAAAARRSVTDQTAEADQAVTRAGRQAEATVAEAHDQAARVRRQLEADRAELEADRAALVARLKQRDDELAAAHSALERDRDALADDRRALEDLAAEVARQADQPAPAAVNRPARPKPATPAAPAAAPKLPAAGKTRRPRSESIELGAAKYKADVKTWADAPPKKADVMQVCAVHSELAMDIRDRLIKDAEGN